FARGAAAAQRPTGELFGEQQLVTHGGYIGAGPAYLGLMLLGMPVSVVIALGIMAIGLVVIGFSVRKVIDVVNRKREERAQREEEELGVAPAGPFIPVAAVSNSRPGRSRNVDRHAKTQMIGDGASHSTAGVPTRKLVTERDQSQDVTIPVASTPSGTRMKPGGSEASQTRQLTRKLGKRASSEPETDSADTQLIAKAKPKSEPENAPMAASPDDTFQLPDMALLKVGKGKRKTKAFENELAETAGHLQQTMEDFGIMAQVVDWIAGPTVTLFEVDLPPGVRVSRLTNLNDDIALALAAPGVRIFAPIPGTHYVGIEVPNATRENVLLGDVLKEVHGGPLEMAIGKDVEGNAIICDLAKMPHLLIGGTTGSGKSVGINAMIMSMLMRSTPSQVRFIMIDPKRVEFAPYDGIPHLYVPVVTEPKEAASALSWGVAEMERRLKLFSKVGVRNIATFNEKARKGELDGVESTPKPDGESADGKTEELPYIVIIIDELADLMMNVGKEVEFSISRIAQLARAAGIHLIVATQRPSANVVTGLIKANITNRMAFNVASGLDSRVILDTAGAESLIGNGDLLLSKPEYAKPVRIQGCFTSDDEIAAVVAAVKEQGEPDYHSEILQTNVISLGDSMPDGSGGSGGSDDPLVWEAADIVVSSGLGSTSNIQRKLKVGYARAGRIMDMLEEKGVVGPPNGSKPRDVLVDAMELEALKAFEAADEQ
ncbi:MAG: DNA translocase FtsK, partial [Eggerthellaceae bacterium]|nr:DNA translocase FtsK [Eggerthellaceae bacterium]